MDIFLHNLTFLVYIICAIGDIKAPIDLPRKDRASIRGPACMGGINIKQYVLAQRPGFIFPMHRNPWVMKQPHREPLLALENADAMPAIENGQLAISDGAMDEQPVIPRPKAACR